MTSLVELPTDFAAALESANFERFWSRFAPAGAVLHDGHLKLTEPRDVQHNVWTWAAAVEPRTLSEYVSTAEPSTCCVDVAVSGHFVRPLAGIFPLGGHLTYRGMWTFRRDAPGRLRIWRDANLWQWLRSARVCRDRHGPMQGPTRERYVLLPAEDRPLDLSEAARTIWAQRLELPPRLARVAGGWVAGLGTRALSRHLDVSPATLATYSRDLYSRLDVHSKAEAIAKLLAAASESTMPAAPQRCTSPSNRPVAPTPV